MYDADSDTQHIFGMIAIGVELMLPNSKGFTFVEVPA